MAGKNEIKAAALQKTFTARSIKAVNQVLNEGTGKIKGYVQFTGSQITDTPVSLTVDAKAGDKVRIRVSGGKAWLTGNDTAPPSNDKEKVQAVKNENTRLAKRIKAVEDGVEMKGVVHFKDLESDEETTIKEQELFEDFIRRRPCYMHFIHISFPYEPLASLIERT